MKQGALTEYGHVLLPVVKEGMDDIEEAMAIITRSTGEKSQRFNVAATPLRYLQRTVEPATQRSTSTSASSTLTDCRP